MTVDTMNIHIFHLRRCTHKFPWFNFRVSNIDSVML